MMKKTFAIFLIILTVATSFLPAATSAAKELVILHTNDLHGESFGPKESQV